MTPRSNEDKIDLQFRKLGRVVVLGWAMITASFGMGVWVATLEIRTEAVAAHAAQAQLQIDILSQWKTATIENRYTFQDAVKDQRESSNRFVANENRLQRLEDSTLKINESLDRIEKKIGTKP